MQSRPLLCMSQLSCTRVRGLPFLLPIIYLMHLGVLLKSHQRQNLLAVGGK